MRPLVASLSALAALAAAGCGGDSGMERRGLTVVATTTHVADLVRSVGGERVDVRGMLHPGADPHDYEPRPSDVASLADAAVVFRSGGEVDAWLDDVIDNAGGEAAVVTLLDSVRTRGGGEPDPHWWQDPRNAVLAVGAIRAALSAADPGGRRSYERAAAGYARRLRQLDARVAACMRRVPDRERKLVTTHDALGYFAARYDVEVVGVVIPSLSTQAQPSARDVDRLVDQIRAEDVRAIFPETALDARLERAIARESGAEVGAPLRLDSLGPEGSAGDKYIDAMAANAAAMAAAMTGGRVACRPAAAQGG